MSSLINEIGNRHGSFVVIGRAGKIKDRAVWMCRCDCGKKVAVHGRYLRRGIRTNCGCLRQKTTHHPMYALWSGMIKRCNTKSNGAYPNYGGRGIRVCDRWERSFLAFVQDMGDRPSGRSLDRINNDGNYEPGNCRWATAKEQMQNRRIKVR